MDDRLALGDLATFAVDRDQDRLVQRIGEERGQLLFAAAAGIAGLALLETGAQWRTAGAHLVIVLVIRHMHPFVVSIIATNWRRESAAVCHTTPMIVNIAKCYYRSRRSKEDGAPSAARRPPSEHSLSALSFGFLDA